MKRSRIIRMRDRFAFQRQRPPSQRLIVRPLSLRSRFDRASGFTATSLNVRIVSVSRRRWSPKYFFIPSFFASNGAIWPFALLP